MQYLDLSLYTPESIKEATDLPFEDKQHRLFSDTYAFARARNDVPWFMILGTTDEQKAVILDEVHTRLQNKESVIVDPLYVRIAAYWRDEESVPYMEALLAMYEEREKHIKECNLKTKRQQLKDAIRYIKKGK